MKREEYGCSNFAAFSQSYPLTQNKMESKDSGAELDSRVCRLLCSHVSDGHSIFNPRFCRALRFSPRARNETSWLLLIRDAPKIKPTAPGPTIRNRMKRL